ncbi:MAG: hypothetical protein DRJ05_13230 [Bacteroidetes bacterium]|nr:MAG: hypothetical protein DRJ05_13230 [Bacteroidota bacterium]
MILLNKNVLVRWSIVILFFTFSCSDLSENLEKTDANLNSGVTLDARQISELNENIQTSLNEIQKKYGFPGITAAYKLPQAYVSGFASGMADKEKGLVMQPHMLMLSASIGKMYVGAVLSQLVAENLLNLNDPLSKWLGHKTWFKRLPNADSITIAHLASHTAGLPDHVYSKEFAEFAVTAKGNPGLLLSPEELISFILDKEPLCSPGKEFKYTDTGFLLLGLAIEEATHQNYYDLLKERLLNPLNLLETVLANRRDIPNITQAYTPKDNMFGLPEFVIEDGLMTHHPGIEWTGGGLASSATDLVRWSSALFTTDIAGANYTELVMENASTHITNLEVPYVGYGLGVKIRDTEFGRMFYHTGWTLSYYSNVSYYVDSGISLSFMVNTDNPQYMTGKLLKPIRNELMKVMLKAVNKAIEHKEDANSK